MKLQKIQIIITDFITIEEEMIAFQG